MIGNRSWIARFILLGAILACREPLGVPEIPRNELVSRLTEDVAAKVSAEGRFDLGGSEAVRDGEIDHARARQLAWGYWHDIRGVLRLQLERDRGARIDVQALQLCERSYYAESAYEPPDVELRPSLRKALGAQWLVGLCVGDEQQVSISVSALATDVQLKSDGRGLVRAGSGDFTSMGVPVGVSIPSAPEAAVLSVADRAQRRVSTVPKLVRRTWPFGGHASVWHLSFERPVAVRGHESDLSIQSSRVVVGYLNGWQTIEVAHPKISNAHHSRDGSFLLRDSRQVSSQLVALRLSPDAHVDLELIRFGGR